ncbi:MAG: fused MFS/spermidine synthase [Deltaproteobacteria bacterium]|nr:fused MFS/spermidine synthase [Deltaproteobacteria bacterium]
MAKSAKSSPKRGVSAPAERAALGAGHRIYLFLAAFCSGASIMIVELAGNRLLAPWFGNSLYTWTGLIGVILVAIAVGYYVGGSIADRKPAWSPLVYLLLGGAASTGLIPVAYRLLEKSVEPAGVVAGPIVASLGLFALPGCLLAAVSPFTVRLFEFDLRRPEDRRVGGDDRDAVHARQRERNVRGGIRAYSAG